MKKLFNILAGLVLPFITSAQLQNLDFEQWNNPISENLFGNIPTGWVCSNGDVVLLDQPFLNPPASDAQNGDHALCLSIWYNLTKDNAFQVAPISYRPTSLQGHYKYLNNIVTDYENIFSDTAMVSVFLTKFNPITETSDTIGIGVWQTGDSINTYTPFTCNITYTSTETPDSIIILLDPSMVKRPGALAQYRSEEAISSFFLVDNLSLSKRNTQTKTTGINDLKPTQPLSIYPNPAYDVIQYNGASGETEIWNLQGQKLETGYSVSSGSIDITKLQTGAYLLLINDGETIHRATFLKH